MIMRTMYQYHHLSDKSKAVAFQYLKDNYDVNNDEERVQILFYNSLFFNEDGTRYEISRTVQAN